MLQKFADSLQIPLENGKLTIPSEKGKGYLKGLLLDNGFGIMIRNYELYEDMLVVKRGDTDASDRIIINFTNIFFDNKGDENELTAKDLPTVQIGKGKIDLDMLIPKRTKYRTILLGIDKSRLKELLGEQHGLLIYDEILNTEHHLLFEEVITPRIQKVANEIIECDVPVNLQNTYYRIKAEEIVCLLFAELFKRENSPLQNLNEDDVLMLYKIRDKILQKLDVPPLLSELANLARMSESKLKKLFKQIFGNSIYNYYQSFRMKEAARLLKEKKVTVSEVGYQLGFTNMSHFGKIFEEHIGMKPKKYSKNS
ncbi:AraC family transcriptional regulator [Flavobacterium sp. 9AF]|uniref:helix-turn-helix domain-containing protein n=1 Tax=Flavobacterium sp. 9AF TaxID=2653142 RepID=UPI0019164B28|nr:helix-turn-helix transcriptional regulator [Flavobacterium sp. 9AF]